MYAPLDPDGRSLQNLYNIILSYGIDELKDSNKFGNFFIEFKYLIDKEEKFLREKTLKTNDILLANNKNKLYICTTKRK